VRLRTSVLPLAILATLGLSLAGCEQKPDPGKASTVAADPAAAPAAAPAPGEGEAEAEARGPEAGHPYGPQAGMERGRERREHGMRMAPDPAAAADKPPQ
jgi:hypothetical protein